MTENELRLKVVDTALAMIGVKEGTAAHAKIIDTYNKVSPLPRGYKVKYSDDWCAAFVSAVSVMLGLTDIIPPECGCGEQIKLFKKLGRWVELDAYVPKQGDVIYYDWQDSGYGDNVGWSDHVGYVTGVTNGVINVVEGNNNNSVKMRQIKVNGQFIRGFGVPDYASKATAEKKKEETTVVTLPELTKGVKSASVLSLQLLLMYKYAISCGNAGADGDYGAATEKAVKQFQAIKGLKQDGICGQQTWTKLIAE